MMLTNAGPEPAMKIIRRYWSWLLPVMLVTCLLGGCIGNGDRQDTLARIAQWEDQRSAPSDSLARLINHTDAHVRLAAVRAAGLIGRDDVLENLIDALSDPSMTIREQAAFSLGLLGNAQAVLALGEMIGGEHQGLRQAALAGLAHLEHDGSLFIEPALHGETRESIVAWDGLRAVAGEVDHTVMIETIQAGLSRAESLILWRVLRCAERAPDSTLVAQIAPFALSANAQIRVHANRALGRLSGQAGNRQALSAVLAGCDDEHRFHRHDQSRVRIAQLRALGQLAEPVFAEQEGAEISKDAARITAILMAGVHDEDPHVARTALDAMANAVTQLELPPEAAIRESLLPVWRIRLTQVAKSLLAHHEPVLRAAAVTAYGALRGGGATPLLLPALNDGRKQVEDAAWLALAEVITSLEPLLADSTGAEFLPAPTTTPAKLQAAFRIWERRHQLTSLQDTVTCGHIVQDLLTTAVVDPDFVLAATAAPLLADVLQSECIPLLLQAYEAAAGEGVGDIRLSVLDALAIALQDSSTRDRIPDQQRLAVSNTLQTAFDSDDLRIRLQARELAVETMLVPGNLIPGEASLQATLPAHRRGARQAPPALPFAAPSVRCVTNRGEFVIELDGRTAPNTVANFLHLIRQGFYDNLSWHRVVPDFVVQGGCPRGDGWGGPGYQIRSEWSRLRYERTAVGIAHSGKDTGGSQFFVTLSEQPHLNGRYTIFGHVTEGMDIVDTIQPGEHFRLHIMD